MTAAAVHQPPMLMSLVQRIPGLLLRVLRGKAANGPQAVVTRASIAGAGLLLGLSMLAKLPKRANAADDGHGRRVGPLQAGIVWMRSDLRVSDHEALSVAAMECSSLVPLYCFDPAEYGKDGSSFERTGPGRARFIIESVVALRQELQALGSDLIVRIGRPQDVLPRLAAQVGAQAVYCHSDVALESHQAEKEVHEALQQVGVQLKTFWGGSTLFHADDLPFARTAVPTNYAHFSQALAQVPVRMPTPTPTLLQAMPAGCRISPGDVPTLTQLGLTKEAELTPCSALLGPGRLRGGEGEALKHLRAFILDVKAAAVRQHEQLQNAAGAAQKELPGCGPRGADLQGMCVGPTFSCKISPWLALGCISPRTVYHEMLQQLGTLGSFGSSSEEGCAQTGQGQRALGSNWLMFELLWRDFFRLKSLPLQFG